jgi:hypothetical protein
MLEFSALVGSWKLVSAKFQLLDTGQMVDVHGPNPRGFAIVSANGRVMFLLMHDGRVANVDKATLFDTMAVYTGRARLDGDVLSTSVDMAWVPAWEGKTLFRVVDLQDDQLTLVTSEQRDQPKFPGRPTKGYAVWRREE